MFKINFEQAHKKNKYGPLSENTDKDLLFMYCFR